MCPIALALCPVALRSGLMAPFHIAHGASPDTLPRSHLAPAPLPWPMDCSSSNWGGILFLLGRYSFIWAEGKWGETIAQGAWGRGHGARGLDQAKVGRVGARASGHWVGSEPVAMASGSALQCCPGSFQASQHGATRSQN